MHASASLRKIKRRHEIDVPLLSELAFGLGDFEGERVWAGYLGDENIDRVAQVRLQGVKEQERVFVIRRGEFEGFAIGFSLYPDKIMTGTVDARQKLSVKVAGRNPALNGRSADGEFNDFGPFAEFLKIAVRESDFRPCAIYSQGVALAGDDKTVGSEQIERYQ